MQIVIESTDLLTELDGVPVREWRGLTAGGIECRVYVHRVAVREDRDTSEFERELEAQRAPVTSAAAERLMRDVANWTEDDWRILHETITSIRRKIASRIAARAASGVRK